MNYLYKLNRIKVMFKWMRTVASFALDLNLDCVRRSMECAKANTHLSRLGVRPCVEAKHTIRMRILQYVVPQIV